MSKTFLNLSSISTAKYYELLQLKPECKTIYMHLSGKLISEILPTMFEDLFESEVIDLLHQDRLACLEIWSRRCG